MDWDILCIRSNVSAFLLLKVSILFMTIQGGYVPTPPLLLSALCLNSSDSAPLLWFLFSLCCALASGGLFLCSEKLSCGGATFRVHGSYCWRQREFAEFMANVCETLTLLRALSPLLQPQEAELIFKLNSAQLQNQALFLSLSEDRCCLSLKKHVWISCLVSLA